MMTSRLQLRIAAFQAAVTVLLVAFSCADEWELEWHHFKLSKSDLDKATVDLKNIKNWRQGNRYAGLLQILNIKDSKTEEEKKRKEMLRQKFEKVYTHIDLSQDRVKPLCRFFAHQIKYGARTSDPFTATEESCTCAFVGPNLVLTAAHCFNLVGVKPGGDWVTHLVQDYGIEGNEDYSMQHAYDNINLVVEWWYPKAYNVPVGQAKPVYESGFDFALVKVQKPSKTWYNVMAPIGTAGKPPVTYGLMRKDFLVLGYPADYKGGEVPVSVHGDLRYLPSNEGDLANNHLAHYTSATVQGAMAKGGSGGPWILTDKSLESIKAETSESAAKELSMGVFGISGWATDEAKITASPLVTPRLVQMIRRLETFDEKIYAFVGTTAATVTPVDEQTFRVSFKIEPDVRCKQKGWNILGKGRYVKCTDVDDNGVKAAKLFPVSCGCDPTYADSKAMVSIPSIEVCPGYFRQFHRDAAICICLDDNVTTVFAKASAKAKPPRFGKEQTSAAPAKECPQVPPRQQ